MDAVQALLTMAWIFDATSLRSAAIAAPAFIVAEALLVPHGCSKEKAYLTAMRADLRNLATAQEDRRERGLTTAAVPGHEDFRRSTGVAFLEYTPMAGGFVAVATYPGGTAKRCELRHSWGDEPVPQCED